MAGEVFLEDDDRTVSVDLVEGSATAATTGPIAPTTGPIVPTLGRTPPADDRPPFAPPSPAAPSRPTIVSRLGRWPAVPPAVSLIVAAAVGLLVLLAFLSRAPSDDGTLTVPPTSSPGPPVDTGPPDPAPPGGQEPGDAAAGTDPDGSDETAIDPGLPASADDGGRPDDDGGVDDVPGPGPTDQPTPTATPEPSPDPTSTVPPATGSTTPTTSPPSSATSAPPSSTSSTTTTTVDEPPRELLGRPLRITEPVRPVRGEVGVPVDERVLVQGGDGGELRFAADGLPEGVTIDERTGQIAGTPERAGVYQVFLAVRDGADFASQGITWIVE